MLLSLLETILVMHLLERDDPSQSVPSREQALSDEKEANSIFSNFQGGETRNHTQVPAWSFDVWLSVFLFDLFFPLALF